MVPEEVMALFYESNLEIIGATSTASPTLRAREEKEQVLVIAFRLISLFRRRQKAKALSLLLLSWRSLSLIISTIKRLFQNEGICIKGFCYRKNMDQQTLAMFNILEIMSAIVCMEIVLYPTKYNENLIREFYSSLITEVENSATTFWAIYVRGIKIAFTQAT